MSTPLLRPLLLTERRTTMCRLSPATVEFLLTTHAQHLRLLPTLERHRYRVTPLGRVGTIETPDRRIVIQPKIPLQNLFYLLDPEGEMPPPTGNGALESAVVEWLASRLAGLLEQRQTLGLHRDYEEREIQGLYLRGRLDVSAQVRESRREQLHCRHDHFSADIPCNQVALAAGKWLADCSLLQDTTRWRLQRCLTGFSEVRLVPLTVTLAELAQRRVPPGYGPLLDLCDLLARSVVPGQSPTFLLDLERVFEGYVSRTVEHGLAPVEGIHTGVQWTRHLHGEGTDPSPDLQLRPDITLERGGRCLLVLDVKWKRLPSSSVIVDDVYQVAAYCTALGANSGVLVYPGCQREHVWEYRLGSVTLTIRTLDVAGPPVRCHRAATRLGRWLRSRVSR